MTAKVIVRKKKGRGTGRTVKATEESLGPNFVELSDKDKYKVIQLYAEGKTYAEIGSIVHLSNSTIKNALSILIKELTLVQETRKLEGITVTLPTHIRNSKALTEDFLELAKDNAMIYAYYYGLTLDSKYALSAAELDTVPKNISSATKLATYRMRGQYLQSIPEVQEEIRVVRTQQLSENEIDRPYVIQEITSMLEEEKLRSTSEPSARKNRMALIKMLGESISLFSQRIEVEQVSGKDNLQLLIDLAEQDIIQEGSYTIEDTKND